MVVCLFLLGDHFISLGNTKRCLAICFAIDGSHFLVFLGPLYLGKRNECFFAKTPPFLCRVGFNFVTSDLVCPRIFARTWPRISIEHHGLSLGC